MKNPKTPKDMMFDMKQARDSNTTSYWTKSIFRLFIDDKLFIANNNQTCFESEEDAWKAFYDSYMWMKISEYVSYSQVFFNKVGDEGWREDFENKIIERMNVIIKEYVERTSTENK